MTYVAKKLIEANAEIKLLHASLDRVREENSRLMAGSHAHEETVVALREDNRKLRDRVAGYRIIAETYRKMLEG